MDNQQTDYQEMEEPKVLPTINHTTSSPAMREEEMNKTIQQESKAIDNLAEKNTEIDNFYKDQLNKDWGVIEKFGNKKMYDQVHLVKAKLFTETAEYRTKFYKTTLDARLAYLREKCDSSLKCIKSLHRQRVASFVMEQLEKLRGEVMQKQINFLEMMKEKYAYAESLKPYPTMHKRYMDTLFKDCLLYTSPSPRDRTRSRMPSSA